MSNTMNVTQNATVTICRTVPSTTSHGFTSRNSKTAAATPNGVASARRALIPILHLHREPFAPHRTDVARGRGDHAVGPTDRNGSNGPVMRAGSTVSG